MGRLDDKVLLLTGAGSGIGRASALRAAQEGARLFLTDVAVAGLEETTKRVGELGAQVESRAADISDEQQARASVVACVERFGKLDVLCNNAGIIAYERVHEMSLAFWRRILSVNLDGTFLMTRESIPHLLQTKGAIVNLGSTAGLSGLAYGSAYSASKGAIHAFTRAIAVEYADQGLRANSICPASIQTGMSGTAKLPKAAKLELLNRLASLHGAAGPDVIADVVVFLASDEARFISGTEIRVDGAALA
jgi:meso-butanediol dehydrogenase/(S,S)-butanediol dehydrogenase/diacetyl reductase